MKQTNQAERTEIGYNDDTVMNARCGLLLSQFALCSFVGTVVISLHYASSTVSVNWTEIR